MEPAKLVLENGKEIFIGATSYNGDVVVIRVVNERGNEVAGGSLFTINSKGFYSYWLYRQWYWPPYE